MPPSPTTAVVTSVSPTAHSLLATLQVLAMSRRPGLLLGETAVKASWWDTTSAAWQGVWAVGTDHGQRAALEDYLHSKIIQDGVLSNAINGSTLTFALFHQLQNPLWKDYYGENSTRQAFGEWTAVAGPALTNFHDGMFRLQNKVAREFFQQQQQQQQSSSPAEHPLAAWDRLLKEEEQTDTTDNDNTDLSRLSLNALMENIQSPDWDDYDNAVVQELWQRCLGPNAWTVTANLAEKEEEESLEAAVQRMMTPGFWQSLYYSTYLGTLTNAVRQYEQQQVQDTVAQAFGDNTGNDDNDNTNNNNKNSMLPPPPPSSAVTTAPEYEEGSAQAGQVALLSARVETLEGSPPSNYRFEDVDYDQSVPRVAAQVEVLYEMSSKYREWVLSEDKNSWKRERVEYTSLGVAVFEGWLSHPQHKTLEWKIPLLREPHEFVGVPTVRTVLEDNDDDENNDNNNTKEEEETTKSGKQEDSSSSS